MATEPLAYDVCWPRTFTRLHNGVSEERTAYVRVGKAWRLKDTQGFRLELYVMPPAPLHDLPTTLLLFAVRDKQ